MTVQKTLNNKLWHKQIEQQWRKNSVQENIKNEANL